MNRSTAALTLSAFLLAALLVTLHLATTQPVSPAGEGYNPPAAEGTAENPQARLEFEWLRLRDPVTGRIPKNIAGRELEFVHRMASEFEGQGLTAADAWVARGPFNIGGRTKALAIDVTNEDILLAGSTSSGMFKSTDGGGSWVKTTAPNQLHSVTSVAQNKAPGREHIWYYATGDRAPFGLGGSSADGFQWAHYRGDGIYKSVDGGDTWQLLESTSSDSPEQTDLFDFVSSVHTFGEDGVIAATATGIFKSVDGGQSWTRSFAFEDGDRSPSIEVTVTADGVFYATIAGDGPDHGIHRSDDGENWVDITPDDWPESTVRSVMGVVPSNPNAVYFFTEVASLQQELRKYEAGVGWSNLSGGLPFNAQLATFGGILLMIYVKPDDENTLFLGAIDLFRSSDGGQSFEVVSGTGPNFHVDQTSIAFYPSDPDSMIVGNDGGLFRTGDNAAETVGLSLDWESLNNGYLTTQFYTVSIDHGTAGSEEVLGGTQDNGTVLTSGTDPADPWDILVGGDGAFNSIVDGGETIYYANAATFKVWRHTFPNGGWQQTEVTPAGGRAGLWLTYFQLDPHDQKVMYLPSQRMLWRNLDLTAIPHQVGAGPTDVNWDTLENVTDHYITALGMSAAEPRRLYYAGLEPTRTTRLFYIDDPHEGQPSPVDITGENFPVFSNLPIGDGPWINCIAVDPRDANKVLVVFSSYSILSIYASDDGGGTWTAVSGNLEENPDGSGSGPSVRWVETLYVDDQPVYLAGTSVGLFSASELDGMSTRWIPEAQTTIGNVIVDMIDVRQSDGFIAVATHGNGVYTSYLTQVPTGITAQGLPDEETFELSAAYPNPFRSSTTIGYRLPATEYVTAAVYDVRGRKIETLASSRQDAGRHQLYWNAGSANVASGTYFIRLEAGGQSKVAKVVVQSRD